MAVGHVPRSARHAEWLREHWRPYGQNLSERGRQARGILLDRPDLAQCLYYGLTGIWPWVHMPSFLWVTGPKTDLWLVQTVGLLIVAVAVALGVSAWRRERSASVICLAVGSALALLFVDVYFVAQRVIPPVYLLDAAAEVGLIALWIAHWRAHAAAPARPADQLPVAHLATPQEANGAPTAAHH